MIMGIDTQLIADGTYFVIEIDGQVAGCGGWSRRNTLYGGDHSAGRDAARASSITFSLLLQTLIQLLIADGVWQAVSAVGASGSSTTKTCSYKHAEAARRVSRQRCGRRKRQGLRRRGAPGIK